MKVNRFIYLIIPLLFLVACSQNDADDLVLEEQAMSETWHISADAIIGSLSSTETHEWQAGSYEAVLNTDSTGRPFGIWLHATAADGSKLILSIPLTEGTFSYSNDFPEQLPPVLTTDASQHQFFDANGEQYILNQYNQLVVSDIDIINQQVSGTFHITLQHHPTGNNIIFNNGIFSNVRFQ